MAKDKNYGMFGDESTYRANNINSLSKTLSAAEKDIGKELTNNRDISGIGGINSALLKILNQMNRAMMALAQGTKNFAVSSARAVHEGISEYGRAIGEDINYNKKNIVALALSKATPIFGYFAAKFMETDVFKNAFINIKRKMNEIFSSGWNFVKNKFKRNKKSYGATEDYEEIPKMKKGGVIKKGGLTKLHAAEVVMPIEKFLNETKDKIGSNKYVRMLLIQIGNLRDYFKKQFIKDLTSAYKKVFKSSKRNKREQTDFNMMRVYMEGQTSRWRAWSQSFLLNHPLIRNLKFGVGLLTKAISSPFKFIFKKRGGYEAMIPKGSNTFGNMNSILAMTFAQSMYKYDRMINLLYVIASNAYNGFLALSNKQPLKTNDMIEPIRYNEITHPRKRWRISKGIWIGAKIFGVGMKALYDGFKELVEPPSGPQKPVDLSYHMIQKGGFADRMRNKAKSFIEYFQPMHFSRNGGYTYKEQKPTLRGKITGRDDLEPINIFADMRKYLKKISTSTGNTDKGLSKFSSSLKKLGNYLWMAISSIGSMFKGLPLVGAAGKLLTGVGSSFMGSALGKGLGKLKIGGKGLGIAGGIYGALDLVNDAMGGYNYKKLWFGRNAGKQEGIMASIGGALGGTGKGLEGALHGVAKGGAVGAAVGSFVPVIGTALGGAIGAIAGGILGFVGGEKISKGLNLVTNKIKDIVSAIWEMIKSPFTLIKSGLTWMSDWASKKWDDFKEKAKEDYGVDFDHLFDIVKQKWENAKEDVKEIFKPVIAVVKYVGDGLTTAFDWVLDMLENVPLIGDKIKSIRAGGATPTTSETAKSYFQRFKESAGNMYSSAKNAVGGAYEKTKESVGGAYGRAKEAVGGAYKKAKSAFSGIIPDAKNLGSLSAWYESGNKGSSSVGWDATGGASFGKYQIATKTGTMGNFLNYLKNSGNTEAYDRLVAAKNQGDWTSQSSPFANTWLKLVEEKKLTDEMQHGFIKSTHFDKAYASISDPKIRDMIDKNDSLKQVLWSTAVQHGAGGAANIFNKMNPNENAQDMINKIYDIRGTKFGSSTSGVRAAVLNRFKEEKELALNMAKETASKGIDQVQLAKNSVEDKLAGSQMLMEQGQKTNDMLNKVQDSVSSGLNKVQSSITNVISNNTSSNNSNGNTSDQNSNDDGILAKILYGDLDYLT